MYFFADKHLKREYSDIVCVKSMLKKSKDIHSDVRTKNDCNLMLSENEHSKKTESENHCHSLHCSVLQ